MVSFVSISKGALFVSMMLIRNSYATPPLSGLPSDVSQDSLAVHSNFTLPSLIASRTQAVLPNSKTVGSNSEIEKMSENIEWFQQSGVDYTGMVRRGDIKTLNKMLLDIPEVIYAASEQNLQSRLDANFGDSMILASPSQLADHKFYAGIAATAYCREVTGLGLWTCKNCQKYVPDGQIIFKFNTPIADTTGFILRSNSKKTINLVFRGTNSVRQTLIVSMLLCF